MKAVTLLATLLSAGLLIIASAKENWHGSQLISKIKKNGHGSLKDGEQSPIVILSIDESDDDFLKTTDNSSIKVNSDLTSDLSGLSTATQDSSSNSDENTSGISTHQEDTTTVYEPIGSSTAVPTTLKPPENTSGISTHQEDTTTEHGSSTAVPTTLKPPDDMFYVKDSSGNVCILMKFDASFDIKYKNEKSNTRTKSLNVPKNVTVDNNLSDCGASLQKIGFTFNSNSFVIIFNRTSEKVFVNGLILEYVSFDAKSLGENITVYADNLNLFSAKNKTSYKCSAKFSQKLNDNVTLHIENYQGQAFRDREDYIFQAVHECADDDLSQAIPIAVGCALAVLVIIVLIAYFIGQRRNRNRREEEGEE